MKATGATPGAERSLLRWRNAVFVIFWLSGFQFASWAARVPNVRDILAASTSEMGVLIFGLALGAVLGLLASSHVIVRLGATASILIFLSLLSIGLVMVGLFATIAPGFVVIFVALLVLGAGNAITDVAMNLSGAANERRIGRTLMPMFHAAFSLGTMMGAGFGALSEQLGVPIGVHLTGVGVVAILTTRITVRFLQPAEQVADDQRRPADDSMADPLADAPSAQGWRARLAVWKDPRVLVLGLIVLGMAFAEGTANDWLSLSMVDGYGTTNPVGAAIFGVFVTAMTLGRLLGGRVLDRFGRVLALRATSALALIGLVLVILGPNLAVA
ncbi:MAG: MFS transporter, partial [Microlunatus sp.]|nr:MFS transporter [Microlunatus sp.]